MERQMDGHAKHNRAPPTRWRGPKYILGHADVLINDTHVFVNANTCTFKAKNNDNSYFYKNSGLSFQWVPYYVNSSVMVGKYLQQTNSADDILDAFVSWRFKAA